MRQTATAQRVAFHTGKCAHGQSALCQSGPCGDLCWWQRTTIYSGSRRSMRSTFQFTILSVVRISLQLIPVTADMRHLFLLHGWIISRLSPALGGRLFLHVLYPKENFPARESFHRNVQKAFMPAIMPSGLSTSIINRPEQPDAAADMQNKSPIILSGFGGARNTQSRAAAASETSR